MNKSSLDEQRELIARINDSIVYDYASWLGHYIYVIHETAASADNSPVDTDIKRGMIEISTSIETDPKYCLSYSLRYNPEERLFVDRCMMFLATIEMLQGYGYIYARRSGSSHRRLNWIAADTDDTSFYHEQQDIINWASHIFSEFRGEGVPIRGFRIHALPGLARYIENGYKTDDQIELDIAKQAALSSSSANLWTRILAIMSIIVSILTIVMQYTGASAVKEVSAAKSMYEHVNTKQ